MFKVEVLPRNDRQQILFMFPMGAGSKLHPGLARLCLLFTGPHTRRNSTLTLVARLGIFIIVSLKFNSSSCNIDSHCFVRIKQNFLPLTLIYNSLITHLFKYCNLICVLWEQFSLKRPGTGAHISTTAVVISPYVYSFAEV